MTDKERFIWALQCKPPIPGRVPHFELVFFLTMETFGDVHPIHRSFSQWRQMSQNERQLHRQDIADVYIKIAEKYDHSAIFFHPAGWSDDCFEETIRCLEIIKEKTHDRYFLMIHGDATYAIPDGDNMISFINNIADDSQNTKLTAQQMVEQALERARRIQSYGVLDGFALCSDYCFNDGPFLSPAMFDDFVTPYLKQLIAGYRQLGFYTIKHTDGNIMPILDSIMECKPDALHSLDPQAGVDIAEVKKITGDMVCLIGNVNCGLLDSGTNEQVIESAKYALKHGMPGGGYIFSTSNCIYTGMDVKRYELILDVWRKEGNYEN